MKSRACDIIVIGAGPAGLSFARALADTSLNILILEKQPKVVLADPPLDGRDIACTHDTLAVLDRLDMKRHLPQDDMSPIRSARVFSGASSYFLGFDTRGTGKDFLGCLVPNNAIRRAAWKSLRGVRNVTVLDGVEVAQVTTDAARGTVRLADGRVFTAPLVVAADSRFSASRAQMGIGVARKDFHRTAIVCRMTHTLPHGEIAQECFFDGWTLAILPLQGGKVSIVATLPDDQVEAVMKMPDKAFAARIERDLGDRLGRMALTGRRHSYPLVAIYAQRFTAQRYALLGDAAVGTHPVTAHGYNLGLAGAMRLADEVRGALRLGIDIGTFTVLDAYNRAHRGASAFLYYGTNLLVGAYTDNRRPMLALRALGLRVANRLPPFRRYVTGQLTGRAV